MSWIVNIVIFLTGCLVGGIIKKNCEEPKKKLIASNENNWMLFQLMTKWVKVKQKNYSLVEYFKRRGYHTIAVYGVSSVGQLFIKELENSDITVLYGIDRNPEASDGMIVTMAPSDELKKVDVIVVTAIYYYDEIEEMLSRRIDSDIVSLEDVITDIMFFLKKNRKNK